MVPTGNAGSRSLHRSEVVLRAGHAGSAMAALELLSDEGYRADGRRATELRKVRARMGVFAQADGSAYIEQGNTKALAVVYGPHEVSRGAGRDGASGPGSEGGSGPDDAGPGSEASPLCSPLLSRILWFRCWVWGRGAVRCPVLV